MRTLSLTVMALTVIAMNPAALSGCSRGSGSAAGAGSQGAAPEARPANALKTAKASAQETRWTCPMHPQIRRDGPGFCPICGMNLVRAETISAESSGDSGEHRHEPPEGHAPVRLPEARRQMIGVKYGTVRKEPLFKSIEASGRVAFDPELYTAQNDYIEAMKQLGRVQRSPLADVRHSAERMVESAKLRLKILGLSDKQIAAIRESGSSGSNLLLPKPGENLWIYAEVHEMDLASVQPGLDATITGSALGGKALSGKVVSVDRVINPATRTAKVRVSVSEDARERALLRPESYVDVTIRSPLGTQVAVPFDALMDTGKEAWVFVAEKEGEITPRRVTVKFHADDWVAIASGLKGGERIVTSANFLIDSESRLKGSAAREESRPQCPEGQVWHEEMKHCMNAP